MDALVAAWRAEGMRWLASTGREFPGGTSHLAGWLTSPDPVLDLWLST